jgi:hypothetical protein
MNTSANLVPTECLIRRARRRRRNVWLTVTLAAGVFCGPLWALRAHESATAEHLRDQLAAAEVSLAADERALQQDVTEHNALIDAADWPNWPARRRSRSCLPNLRFNETINPDRSFRHTIR